MSQTPLIIMGVQGTGKSTVGKALAERLGLSFIDGDDLHPAANKEKMASGTPLTDEDRAPWLDAIGQTIADERERGVTCAIVCSALKRRYRDQLRSYAPDLQFVHLAGDRDLIARRIAHRHHEYMPASLLDSQFATLEQLGDDEAGIVASIEPAAKDVVENILGGLNEGARTC
ncbi:gluconokinase [Dermabacter sp. p3-SID358]|uniref:gluconokinase n=1 Tax=Dermabacter sp. p3-SID358 TaxID=2916114 RepID=UPI0021A695D3|nr:gluconokinase [Dermabacter sp. p3-SID358]MCT1866674.1 gluconokinase [Dermabacter sp. p3-SID358]